MADSDKISAKAKDPEFQGRVKAFFQKAAVAVSSEDPATENHDARLVFAGKILYGQVALYQLAMATLTNSTIWAAVAADTEPSDSDIEFTVNSMIDPFALTGAVI